MVFHVGTLSQCASMLRHCGGGEGTDFFVQPNLTIESNNFGAEVEVEVWPKPWDFDIRNHIFQVFRSLAVILHANKQQVGGLVNIIIGLPQRLLHPLPGKAHVCEGGHQNWAGRRLTSLLWSSWLTSSSAAHTLPSPKLAQPHLSASSARGHMKPSSGSEKLLFHCLGLLGPLDLDSGSKQARSRVRRC